MKKYIFFFFAILLVFASSSSLSSCHKGPSCPAYNGIDPARGNQNNPNNAVKTGDNKKDVEKRKAAELKGGKKINRKKSTNLFPSYMR